MAEIVTAASIQIVFNRVISFISSTQNSIVAAALMGFTDFTEDFRRLGQHVTNILGILHDASSGGICLDERWLMSLQDLAFEADDVMDELNYEILQRKPETTKKRMPFNLLTSDNYLGGGMIGKVRAINKKLQDFVEDKNKFEDFIASRYNVEEERKWNRTDVPGIFYVYRDEDNDQDFHAPNFLGRDFEVKHVVEVLTTKQDNKVPRILPIVGRGGLGKTTLARVIYEHRKIKRHFDKRIWISASGDFDATRLLKLILEALVEEPVANDDILLFKLGKELHGRRCLLVLDNVIEDWVNEEWAAFLHRLFEEFSLELDSWLLVTMRNLNTENFRRHGVLLEPWELNSLADDDCWLICKEYVFGSNHVTRSDINASLIRAITRICGGSPLSAKLLGSTLRNKAEHEWPLVLEYFSEARGDVNQVIELVFNQLPYLSLKKCFAYCSIFPKDSYIEKDQLVQLWMAEGCILPNEGTTMELEDIGYNFFNILLRHSLLQDIKKDEYGNITHCKLHDLVHDFARSLISRDVDHLALFGGRSNTDDPSEQRFVRTLILESNISDYQLLAVKSLRTLNLSSTDIESLPFSFGALNHLRFLGLSRTNIKMLPDSICKLYNLQTLRLDNCPSLKELPKDIANLISLRHLYFLDDEEFCMPPKMGQLTSLKTLLFFNLDKENGHRIDEIGCLKNLRGKIVIRKLELVSGEEEAELADLFGKKNVYRLEYQWNDIGKTNDNHEKVLKGLQPHPEIKSLTIRNYNGNMFPSWLLQMAVSVNNEDALLNKLMKVRLINCKSSSTVPMLWQLPFLLHLELKGLTKVTSICPSLFFDSTVSHLYINRSGRPTLFPALKCLKLDSMPNLERWIEIDVTMYTEMFPCLENLSIQQCPKLKTINHHLPSLKELNIRSPFIVYTNIQLENICCHLTNLVELHIHGLSELTCLPDGLLHNNPNLEILRISSCPSLTHVVSAVCASCTSFREFSIYGCKMLRELPEGIDNLCCLEILCIEECPNLKCFPHLNGDGRLTLLRRLKIAYCDGLTCLPTGMIESCCNLRSLRVSHCPNLISFPLDSDHTPSLSFLWISDCLKWTSAPERLWHFHSLSELRIGHFSDSVEFDSFGACLNGLQNLPTLHSLRLYGWPQWTSLPDELQNLSGLRVLYINDFGIEALPNWFEELWSLEELGMYRCKKLKYMPSAIAMKEFTKLRRMSIFDCPLIKKSCSLSEWSSTIFELSIDSKEINFQEHKMVHNATAS